MNEMEVETTIASLRRLCAQLETLRHLDITDLQLPGQQEHYEHTLEDAYAALEQVETALDELGQELAYEHQRLGEAVSNWRRKRGRRCSGKQVRRHLTARGESSLPTSSCPVLVLYDVVRLCWQSEASPSPPGGPCEKTTAV